MNLNTDAKNCLHIFLAHYEVITELATLANALNRVCHRDSDTAQAVKEDVARLEIIMDDSSAILVKVGQPLEHLCHDDSGLLLRQHLQSATAWPKSVLTDWSKVFALEIVKRKELD